MAGAAAPHAPRARSSSTARTPTSRSSSRVQPDDTPGLQRIAEHLLATLAEAGLEPRERAVVYQLITNYVVGSGLFISQLTLDDSGPETIPAVRRAYAALPPADYPHCVESAPFLFPDLDDVYGLGIDMLIAAIEKLATTEERT